MAGQSDTEARYAGMRVHLAGRLEVELDGEPVAHALPGRQGRLLFAYLALNRHRAASRDELIDAVWGESAPPEAGRALSALLSKLRRTLGEATLTGRRDVRLILADEAWVDVEAAAAALERAQEALARGEPRAAWAPAQVAVGIAERGLLPGEDAEWLEARRRELGELELTALETVARTGLALGGAELAMAVRAARALVERSPFRESGHALLMEALAARGDVAEALRVFDALRRLLGEELGAVPSTAVTELHERLLHDADRPRAGAAAPAPARAAARAQLPLPPRLAERPANPLVGRDAVLDRLEAELRRAGAGERRIVALGGEPGIGKTRLTSELGRRAHASGANVLYGRSDEEALLPYQPFVEALEHWASTAPSEALREAAAGTGAQLLRVLPELGRRLPDVSAPAGGDPETARYALFDAVVRLLDSLCADAPLVLLLDDLHWADRPTLLLLRHLARAAVAPRLLVVGTYRENEVGPDHPLHAVIADLRREGRLETVSLSGLDEPAVAEMYERLSGRPPAPGLAGALRGETEGNPFFLEETVRHLTEAGVIERAPARAGNAGLFAEMGIPAGVKEVIGRRIARLPEAVARILTVAAVIGRDFELDVLERVADLQGDPLLEALEQAVEARLLTEVPDMLGRYSFAHALVREALREQLSATRRVRLHRTVGEAIEALHADDPGEHLAELALHFSEAAPAGTLDKAVEYADRAGCRALERLAYEDAVAQFERGLHALEGRAESDERRLGLLLGLGDAQARLGAREAARSNLAEAAALARAQGGHAELAEAALGFAGPGYQTFGELDLAAIELLDEALAALPEHDSPLRVAVLARLAEALYFSVRRDRLDPLSEEAVAMARRLGDRRALAHALHARAWALWSPPHLDARLRVARELIEAAREAGDLEYELHGRHWVVAVLMELNEREALDEEIAQHAELAERLRQPFFLRYAAVFATMRAFFTGRFEEGERLAREALAIAERASSPSPDAVQFYGVHQFVLAFHAERMAELEEPIRGFLQQYPYIPSWRGLLALSLCHAGRLDAAAEELATLGAPRLERIPFDANFFAGFVLAGGAAATVGDLDTCRNAYETLLPYVDRGLVLGAGGAWFGTVGFWVGQLAAALGRLDEAVRHLEDALAAAEQMGARPWIGLVRETLAGVLQARAGEGDADRAGQLAGGAPAGELAG